MNKNRSEGFTIIEVLIVLAIAGLIMLIVFLVVPTAKAMVRDNRRKRDLTEFYSIIKEYQLNNNSTQTPFVTQSDQAKFDDFKAKYLDGKYDQYEIVYYNENAPHWFPDKVDKMVFFSRHYCKENPDEQVSGPGIHPPYAWSVLVGLERTNSYFCLDQGNRDL